MKKKGRKTKENKKRGKGEADTKKIKRRELRTAIEYSPYCEA